MKRMLPVSSGLSWVKMAPLLENAQRDYLVPLLGEKLNNEISWIYERMDPSERSDAEKVVLYLAQRAVANLAFWSNFDAFSLRITDQGFQRQESDTWHPAFKYQEDNLRKGFANAGYNAIDQLLQQLDEHKDDFTAYLESPAFLASQKSIVRNTAEVQDIYEINNSRLVFLRLLPVIRQQTELTLQPILGDELYESLEAWLEGGEETATLLQQRGQKYANIGAKTWEWLRSHARKVVVMAAVRQLLRTTGTVTDRGAYFAELGGDTILKPVDDTRLSLLIADAERALGGYTSRLASFVKVNMEDVYGGSALRVLDRDNDHHNAFWA